MSIEDFIYLKNGSFNSCEFCQEFKLDGGCPTKNYYASKKEEKVTEEDIEEGAKLCKKYIISNLKRLLNENS